MENKEFEERLDRLADKISKTVTDGVRRVEDAFEKDKANPDSGAGEPGSTRSRLGSPKAGVILLVLGLVWLLNSFDFFDHRIFPVLMIIAGIYLVIRNTDR